MRSSWSSEIAAVIAPGLPNEKIDELIVLLRRLRAECGVDGNPEVPGGSKFANTIEMALYQAIISNNVRSLEGSVPEQVTNPAEFV